MQKERIVSIDVLKTIFVFIVAMFHYDPSLPQDLYLFVDALFIITGYTTMLSLLRHENDSEEDYFRYIIKSRIFRLWIPYVMVWGVWVIILNLKGVYTEFYSYLNTLFLLQSIGFTDGGEIMGMNSIGISWPLAAEVWVSIIMFPVLKRIHNRIAIVITSLVTVFLSMNMIYCQSQMFNKNYLGQLTNVYADIQGLFIPIALLRCIVGLCIGVIIHEIRSLFKIYQENKVFNTLILLICMAIYMFVFYRSDFRVRDTMAFPILAGIFVFFFVSDDNYLSKIFSSRFIKHIGKLYFGIFLMHPFAFSILNALDMRSNLLYTIVVVAFATMFHFTIEESGKKLFALYGRR